MLRHLVGSFCFSLTLLLAACGDGDSSSAMGGGTPSATASSNVVKGIIRNGVIKASRWQGGAYTQVASVLTDGAGAFSVSIPGVVAGEVLRLDLVLSTDPAHPTEMLCDADHCGAGNFGDWVPLTTTPGLSSWVSVGSDNQLTVMPMTPVSTLLVRYAESLGAGHLDASSIAMAVQRTALLFGMSPSGLLAIPGNVASTPWVTAAGTDSLKLSLISAAFAQLATDNGKDVGAVVDDYAGAFISNNGRLLQDGDVVSLASLFAGVSKVISWSGATSTQAWADGVLASLQYGLLNPVPSGAIPFDTGVVVDALGTTTDSLGGDIRRVMQEKNAATLEQLVAGQLSQFGWLGTPDTVAVAGVAVQSVLYAVMGSIDLDFPLFPLQPSNGLTPVLDSAAKTLHITGTQNGVNVDLTFTLPPLYTTMLQVHPLFVFGVTGTVGNASINSSIDGTLTIDATGTNFTPLVNSISSALLAVMQGQTPDVQAITTAIAGILRTGKATFTVDGSAGITSLNGSNSTLAVSGKASLIVDMAGGSNGAIAAHGSVDHGSLVLPDGDHFEVDPADGDFLQFALTADGTFSTRFAANVLSHGATVTASGDLATLGVLLSNLRDGVATQIESLATLDFSAMFSQLLTDIGHLHLTLNGQANIADFGHVYTLSLANGELTVTQPDSTTVALDITISQNGLLARAGGQWWLISLSLADLVHPVLTVADASGSQWQWTFDFSALLPPPPV